MIYPLPKIKVNKSVYIYGAGVVGTIYRRQLEQAGELDQIKAFLETSPKSSTYLDLPVLSVRELKDDDVSSSQVLIASHAFIDDMVNELIGVGFKVNQIIYPKPMKWERVFPVFKNRFYKQIKVCTYPVIKEKRLFDSLYKRIVNQLSLYENEFDNIVVDISISFDLEKEYPISKKINLLRFKEGSSLPGSVIDSSDAILLLEGGLFKELAPKNQQKIYLIDVFLIPSIVNRYKLFLSKLMQVKHSVLLNGIRGKDKVRVVFLVFNKSVWKADSVYLKMLNDSYFDPVIFVCPFIYLEDEQMWKDIVITYNYFKKKNYSVVSAWNSEDKKWRDLSELNPDVVFFLSQHYYTKEKYYVDAYKNYLTYYIPYYFMATDHGSDNSHRYNTEMILSMYKIFWPHDVCLKLSKQFSGNKGCNGVVTGYPATEDLVIEGSVKKFATRWKKNSNSKIKIIYAPHHSIENYNKTLSTFLDYAYDMKELALKYRDNIQWSFKPHPVLKRKLYMHPKWGPVKTNLYYNFWKKQSFTQLDEGEYNVLFLESDAIIHDCSSFIVEYAFVRKPCLYLINKNNLNGLLNEFGVGVMQTYKKAKSLKEIESFIISIITNELNSDIQSRKYIDDYIFKYYNNKLPSDRIISYLKKLQQLI